LILAGQTPMSENSSVPVTTSDVRSKMITTAESVRKLLISHFSGDEQAFRNAAEEYVEEERRKNHHVLANELERVLGKTNGSLKSHTAVLSLLGLQNGNLPKDKDRDVLLVNICEPERELSELVLSDEVRQGLDRVITERRGTELLGAHGIRPAGKILLCGPPGCGKTVAAEALARALYLPFATVRFDAVVSSYLGETASNIRKVFDFARSRPMVLFFDEFDAIGKHRTAEDEHGELKRVVNSFLQLLDGFRSETLTIAATNHQGLLDPALWRRFDEILLFPKPNANQILELLTRMWRQIGVSQSVKLDHLAESLFGMTHADVERLAVDAIKQTILTSRKEIEPGILDAAVERQHARTNVTEQNQGSNSSKLRTRASSKRST
jgi:ATP-dependent 26S proteasome regulatory subunit